MHINIKSSKFYVNKFLINNEKYDFEEKNNLYFISTDKGNAFVDVYLLPKYFKKRKTFKLILYVIDNLISGSGLNLKEIKSELTGLHIYGVINNDMKTLDIDIDNNNFGLMNHEKYVSKDLHKKYYFFVVLPSLLILIIILGFLIWAFCTILLGI